MPKNQMESAVAFSLNEVTYYSEQNIIYQQNNQKPLEPLKN